MRKENRQSADKRAQHIDISLTIAEKMIAMELIHTAESLQGVAADLLAALGAACGQCDGCQVEMLCDLMEGEIRPAVSIPDYVLEEPSLDPDYKLTFAVNAEDGRVQITEADHRFDLTDLPPELVHTLRESKVCLADLEEKLMQEEVVYGAEFAEGEDTTKESKLV